jgi:hypothetical protein
MYLEKSVVPKLVRWRLRLLEFNYSVIHIPGSSNVVADQLSRLNLLSSSLDIIQRVQVYRLVIIEGTQVSTSDIISNFHNEVVGHHGVSQTCILIKRAKRHWPGFHTDIRQFIKACVICQKVKHQPVPELSLQKYHFYGSYPMRDLSVDSIGPLPADDLGNRHILVIIDNFTKFVSLFPTLSTTALSYAQALLSHTGIYGIMSTIRSDGGTQFTADICTQLAKLFNFEHHIILPYHPQANGIVERKNAEIMKHLRAIILTTKDKHHWSLYLPIVQRILNSTIDTTSGVSPSELIFSNQLPIMSPLLVQSVNATSTDSEHDYIKQITMYTSVLVDRSLKFLQKANVETQAIDNDNHVFAIGDYVLLTYPTQPPHKLSPIYRGPLLIIDKVREDIFKLKDIISGKVNNFHVDRLRIFVHTNATEEQLLLLAAADKDEFVVESIIAHRKASRSKKAYEFRVRWQGYEIDDDTWLPYRNVKDLAALDTYFIEHQELRTVLG